MDFDLDRFLDVDSVISAVFNGYPVVPDPNAPLMLGAQGYQGQPNKPTSSLPDSSWSSPSALIDFDDDGQTWSWAVDLEEVGTVEDPKLNVVIDPAENPILAPDLDMSSAIALSQEMKKKGKRSHAMAFEDDDIPVYRSGFMPMEEACQVPDKIMRDELIKLYFEHFHPFCPVVDEYDFMEFYDNLENEEQLKKNNEFPLFQAMMFVAIGHMSMAQLRRTTYKSIYEGQRTYFEKASALYRLRYTSDHMVLTKVSLLLTYWSPFDAEFQVNSYWVDRAYYHARAIRLWDPQHDSGAMSCRRRIVWWCCLLRDRLISLGLRRPYRLHEADSTWPVVDEADFGLEVLFPKFMNAKTKRAVIEAFIWLCKLSDIMRSIAVFHENNRFDREWSDSLIDGAAMMPELNQVSQFDSMLKNWKEGYRKVNGDYIKTSTPGTSKMPTYVLIINDSILATLYLPYIHCPAGSISLVQRFQKVALRRIKAASSAVAFHVHGLNETSKVDEEIMVGIIAWIALPMALYKILVETGLGDDGSPDEDVGCYSDLVCFLSVLATRFHAAKLLADMMGEATDELVERSKKLGIAQKDALLPEVVDRSKDVEEAELLNCVAKMVDLRLSTDVSKAK